MHKPITKAIIPVAGLGTRFYPATISQPKEMLPVYDTPAIQHIVREAVDAGITDITFVTSPTKHAIRDHFSHNKDLEALLEKRGKHEALAHVRAVADMAHFHYRVQAEPLGDGHAILCGEDTLDDDEPVLVLFGDDLVVNEQGPNAAQQLITMYQKTGQSVVLLQEIDIAHSAQYGMVAMNEDQRITAFVEKPQPKDAPSNMGVVGKFIITPEVRRVLRQLPNTGEEMRLANAFMHMLSDQNETLSGQVLEGIRFDTGSKVGWLSATLHFALKTHPEQVADALRNWGKNN